MKIEINLDETRFKNLVDSELGKFTDEEIHDILQQAISQYVMENNVIEHLFYNKKKNYYGQETDELEPTYRLEQIVKTLDMENTLCKLKEDIQNVLDNNDIIKEFAERIFLRLVSGKINDLLWQSVDLQNLIQFHTNQILDNRLNNQH